MLPPESSRPIADLCRSIAGQLASSERLVFFAESVSEGLRERDDTVHSFAPANWDPDTLLEEIRKSGAEAIIVVPSRWKPLWWLNRAAPAFAADVTRRAHERTQQRWSTRQE